MLITAGIYNAIELLVDNDSFLPADKLPDGTVAADLVFGWASNPSRTKEERLAAYRFLKQWAEGPQLKPRTKGRPGLYDEHTLGISTRVPKSIFDKIPTPHSKWLRDLIIKQF